MQQDSKRARVRCEDDKLADSSVERLGRLVGSLLELAVVGGLLDEVEDFLRKSLVGLGPCCGVVLGHVVQVWGGCGVFVGSL